jgi:pimeloyl-ACP methyl ester carboxylesterase
MQKNTILKLKLEHPMSATIEKNIENPRKAEVWLSRNNPHHRATGSIPNFQDMVKHQFYQNESTIDEYNLQNRYKADSTGLIIEVTSRHLEQNQQQIKENVQTLSDDTNAIIKSWQKASTPQGLWQEWLSYSTDSSKRLLQTVDVLKERGDVFLEHELAGCPPVLDYDYEVIMDAAEFERPCNYVLLRIVPPAGIVTNDDNRPYIIIDPRAGHGAGIGGFKHESQVGVALNQGHPVYFVAFKRLPEPTQTIADITYAEGKFVREVEKRHPNSDAPAIIGNCQGGWAALILAATHPDIKGPIVLNGAPVSAWSGEVGINPMRYKAGVNGGSWLSMLSADMNNGVFDGAALVNNFEQMTPYRNYVGKYYDLYKNPQANRQRFLDFERWWGGFFLMNEAEIKWIVENIFIGNRLARNTGQLEKGVNIDLRNVKAPIIAFASRGDDITPPQQALSWILDAYSDEKDVEVCGQRIIYMIHEQVGHLGIFVSSKIANNEHTGIASIMDMIEVLPPGLYEMGINSFEGHGKEKTFSIDLGRRTFADLSQAIGEHRNDEESFKAVHRHSMAQTQAYEQNLRPLVKAMSNETSAQLLRTTHPMRLQRSIWSSKNPLAVAAGNLSQLVTSAIDKNQSDHFVPAQRPQESHNASGAYARVRLPAIESMQQDNLFLQVEKMFMDNVKMTLDFWRDFQGRQTESMFFGIWSMPWLRQYGAQVGSRRLSDKDALHEVPKVDEALNKISEGDFKDAVVRMMILSNIVADNNIDRDQLMRLTEVLTKQQPFMQLSQAQLSAMIHTQTLIVRFAEDQSIESLSSLLKTKAERINALKLVDYVVGDKEKDQDPTLLSIKKRIEAALNLTDADIK